MSTDSDWSLLMEQGLAYEPREGVRSWVEEERVIHIKAVDENGSAVRLSSAEARDLGRTLRRFAGIVR